MTDSGFFGNVTDPPASAEAAFQQGNFAEAAQAYRAIVAADPANAGAWRALGISLIQLGEFDEAESACQRAATLQPATADSRYAYGYAMGAQRKFVAAIKELDAALALQPNHGPSRQLLNYALIQHGQSIAEEDPRLAETFLERAFKMEHKSASAVGPYLDHLRKTNQKGKAATALKGLDPAVLDDPAIKTIVETMHADPAFHTVLTQASMAKDSVQTRTQTTAPVHSSINYVPCPNCRQQIADYAAICPHCNFQNRAVGTFAGRDTGPNVIWQEVAYTIVAIIWILNAGWQIFAATQMDDQSRNFFLTLAVANAAIGLGLLARMSMVMMIAKIFCYINMLVGSIWLLIALMEVRWASIASNLFLVSLAGFMVYLINFNSDD